MVRKIKSKADLSRVRSKARRWLERPPGVSWEDAGAGGVWSPPMDVFETESEILVSVDIPGVAESDVRVQLACGRLDIEGRKRDIPHSEKVRFFRFEREFGPFRRVVFFPGSVDSDRAAAVIENGVLTVVLPKTQESEKIVNISIRKKDRRRKGRP